ncbi:hypothetical protein TIFTF001_010976 [Ficus carica]|uniref:Thioredoxin n=1 Tax=Ficus carica TaxID=3494 RepID=A0AA88D0B6_FICCA|nr:hypothetical protein TIFTF001_010976 [Ficus carica]
MGSNLSADVQIKSKPCQVVIDFTAAWCKPCQSMEPTLEELATKYKDICIVRIDVDELPDVAAEYGVQAMPTYLLMKKGNQVDKVVGAKKADLEMKIEKHWKSN